MSLIETCIDSLFGIGHHFGGLSWGNKASLEHRLELSKPQQAALQGLKKAQMISELGVHQLLLPPLQRPRLDLLDRAGFKGDLKEKLLQCKEEDPCLLSAIWSSSFVWTANLGHFTPYTDSEKATAQFTPSNLAHHLHRSLEASERYNTLKDWLFPHIEVHPPLPSCMNLADEGAANTTRLFHPRQKHLAMTHMVWGQSHNKLTSHKFPARQSLEALEWIARSHGLDPQKTLYSQQNPEAIDAGVFHNDVICTGHSDLLLCHEKAFVDTAKEVERLKAMYKEVTGANLRVFWVSENELSLEESVSSYFFNSQIIQTEKGLCFLAPGECEKIPKAKALCQKLLAGQWIDTLKFTDLSQSMFNGGGPACLRLRLQLSSTQARGLAHLKLDKEKIQQLESFIKAHYPLSLNLNMLAEPSFVKEAQLCHRKLMDLLNLSYDFSSENLI